MKIKDVEAITGITKQNIRYYERQGLINPDRDKENDYREYSEEDVRILKIIKLFRKLDMPLEEIRKLLQNETELADAVTLQKERLEKERERLMDALDFCDKIEEKEITVLDVDRYLAEMEKEERNGAVFADWIADFKKVTVTEDRREFTFVPDTMCKTKAEFTDALFKYADKNGLNLVITKESMYPEFTIDGVEYMAERSFSRFGAVVHCEMKYPEDVIPAGMSEKKYRTYRRLWNVGIPMAIVLGFAILFFSRVRTLEDLFFAFAEIIIIFVPLWATTRLYKNMKD